MRTAISAIIVVVLLIVVGVGAFFAGSAYGNAQAQNVRAEFFRGRQGTNGTPGATGGQQGLNGQFARPAAAGTVKSVQGNTIVVTQADGSTVTVTVDSQTSIQKTVQGAISDVQPGDRITVISSQTGSNVTAQSIQIRPAGQTQ